MVTQLSRDQVEPIAEVVKPSLWSQSGPVLLSGAFAILVFKWTPFYWPLLLMAFVGCAANRLWKKRGFYLSLMALTAVLIGMIRSGIDPFCSSLLSISIALSWLLIFWGRQEAEAYILHREGKIQLLEENCLSLEKQLRNAKVSFSEENKESIAERERLNHLYAQTALSLSQMKHALEISEKERRLLVEKCAAFAQEASAHRRKEADFQYALEEVQAQLLKWENSQPIEPVATNIVPQEEVNPQEKMQLEQAQRQYVLLREQFDEKSEALDIARKELFHVENALLTLQKTYEEKGYESSEEDLILFKDLQMLEEERRDLEAQVVSLQDFISALLNPKKRPSRSRKNSTSPEGQEHLPLLIQEKIDQTIPVT
jgi:hypothetical protein